MGTAIEYPELYNIDIMGVTVANGTYSLTTPIKK